MNVRSWTPIALTLVCVLLAAAPGVALAGEAPPVTPETLTPLKISANYVEMKVALNPGEAPSNDAIAYKFAYRESPSECLNAGFIEQQSTTSYGTDATTGPREEGIGYITGLLPYRTYTACVIAWNSEHPGEPAIGNPVTFTMNPGFPLTVYVTGQGKVSSYLGSIECSSEECTSNEEGELELAAEETVPGYQFAGWIGCKKISAHACMVDVTAASEVTAVFLKEGKEGPKGSEGPKGGEGATGKEGVAGKEGAAGKEGQAGAVGPTGEKGAAGATGSTGPVGGTGLPGPQGPVGKEGPAGKVELVTCTKKHGKQHCTTKLVSGTVSFTTAGAVARATLSRHGVVYAAGTVRSTRGHTSMRLLPVRRLRAGKYTLTVINGTGSHERIGSESFTLS